MVKQILEEIEEDVKDIRTKKFEYVETKLVPSRDDSSLTFERGEDKKGKILTTCVLYADIRDSVELNSKHTTQTMGRLYSIFSKSILKLAKHHNGNARNIVGDRVMVLFPVENCFTNAVDCAISIYHVSEHIIPKFFPEVNFKCGIGIDFGDLKVVKVGLHRKGSENVENKNLVWVGKPANLASRLTDFANKTKREITMAVSYHPTNYLPFLRGLFPQRFGGDFQYKPYLDKIETKELSAQEFCEKVSIDNDKELIFTDGKIITIKKKETKTNYPPILMSEAVFIGFKSNNLNRTCIRENFWSEVTDHKIKDVAFKVYGGKVHWKI